MDSNPTLHDFVLHLITNQDARLAFQLDPQGTLRSAGLGDLTPADVHDVVPLVVDLTPVRTVLPELGLGGPADDPATAIGQLQHIVHQLPLPNGGTASAGATGGTDVNAATLGAITAVPGAGVGVAATASAAYDVGMTLDAIPAALGGQLGNAVPLDIVTSPVGTVTGGMNGDFDGDGGFPGGINADPIGGFTGILDDLTGGLTGGLTGDLTGGLTGGLTGDLTGGLVGDLTGGLTGELTGGLTGHLTGELSGTIGGLTGTAGGLTGDLTGTLTGTLGGLTDPHDGGLLGGITDGLL